MNQYVAIFSYKPTTYKQIAQVVEQSYLCENVMKGKCYEKVCFDCCVSFISEWFK